MKDIALLIFSMVLLWAFFFPKPKADWNGPVAPSEPVQVSGDLPSPWPLGKMTITPRARYEIQAVVLSKHHYWAGYTEDNIAPYDLALGWGPMSDAAVINALKISQGFRWYKYVWHTAPPIDLEEIIRHSSNHHILPSDRKVLKQVESIKRFDNMLLKGYLVDVSLPDGWRWATSLTREDSGGGACEIFWVESVEKAAAP